MKPLTISPDRLGFLEDGKPWVQRGTLDWPLFGRFLTEGPDVAQAVMEDRRAVGANTIAVAGMWSRQPFLHPSHVRYWESLRPFCQLALDEGLRVQWVVLASTADRINGQPVEWLGMPTGVAWPGMPNHAAQHAHWERFLVTLGDFPNVTFVVANQPGHRDQPMSVDEVRSFVVPQVGDFPRLLAARNNPHESANPILPALDFSCYCSTRKVPQGIAELGASLWYTVWGWADQAKWAGTRQVSVLFEPPRIEIGKGWDDPGLWRQMGRSLCMKGTGGGNIYSAQGRHAQIFTGVYRDCAVEFLGNIPLP